MVKQLPLDIKYYLFDKLDITNLLKLTRINREFYRLILHNPKEKKEPNPLLLLAERRQLQNLQEQNDQVPSLCEAMWQKNTRYYFRLTKKPPNLNWITFFHELASFQLYLSPPNAGVAHFFILEGSKIVCPTINNEKKKKKTVLFTSSATSVERSLPRQRSDNNNDTKDIEEGKSDQMEVEKEDDIKKWLETIDSTVKEPAKSSGLTPYGHLKSRIMWRSSVVYSSNGLSNLLVTPWQIIKQKRESVIIKLATGGGELYIDVTNGAESPEWTPYAQKIKISGPHYDSDYRFIGNKEDSVQLFHFSLLTFIWHIVDMFENLLKQQDETQINQSFFLKKAQGIFEPYEKIHFSTSELQDLKEYLFSDEPNQKDEILVKKLKSELNIEN